MNEIRDILSQRKWRELFIYQFILPISILLAVAIGLALYYQSLGNTFLQVAFDGEFSLISILLIVGTSVELGGRQTRNNRPFSPYDIWIVIVVVGLLLYAFNKASVYDCGSCILDQKFGTREWMFIVANIMALLAAPYYFFTTIISLAPPRH